jgi:hypothetical protein
LNGTWNFEVDNAKRRIDLIEDILVEGGAQGFENACISQTTPPREFQGTVEEIYDRVIFKYQENPQRNTWRFSRDY